MASRDEVTMPATRPKSRKSLAHIPSSHSMDQENMTTDLGALQGSKRVASTERPVKKSRSKSIGPGGLDALKDTSGNRRKSLAAISLPPPKSILKPTMPPLQEIPAHISSRKRSPKKSSQPPAEQTADLIEFDIEPTAKISGTERLANPFEVEFSTAVSETRVNLKTEEEQQAAVREREEQGRTEMQKEVNARRDARRKSLANRRVSFAPEATLHTWDVVVEYQDSTTSSNSSAVRRASSASGGSVGSPHPQASAAAGSDPSEPPSTPPEQVEEETASASPAHQRDLHQKKRRRSSAIPPMNFNNPEDDAFSSSPFSGDSVGEADEIVDDEVSSSDSVDDDDGTMMSIDGGETTNMSMVSVNSGESTSSSSRLDEALREAARQAGTQSMDFNQNEDVSVDVEDEEVVASFAPWTRPNPLGLESREDQENIDPSSAAFKAGAPVAGEESEVEDMTMDITQAVGDILTEEALADDMSMDVTRALGGIIANGASPNESRKKSVVAKRRQSTRRRSSGDGSVMEDETMEFTMAMGGIETSTADDDNEDMTMEFTSVVGGVLAEDASKGKPTKRVSMAPRPTRRNRQSLESTAADETMDMTMAMGGILPTIREQDTAAGMDMTMALGSILPPQLSTGNRSTAKKVMELEADLGSSPFRAEIANSPPKTAPTHTVASETGSPSMAVFRGKGLRRSAEARTSTTPRSRLSMSSTPVKKPATPSKQLTPQPPRPTTPGKTPPSKNIILRTASPKRLFKNQIQATSKTPRSLQENNLATPNKLFQQDQKTGIATPNFVLTPKPRRSSGVGLDKAGLGSPRVTALLDRRTSIGDQARPFVPGQLSDGAHGVRFEDPRIIENELDQEREQEESRENGRKILEREADQGEEEEKDATFNLKSMIDSLTPKKRPLRGRKSLHVGAAKGVLGKRPAELDEEDDDEDNEGVKRLKNHQGSPIKNVKLQAPPSKAETTTGRVIRANRKSLDDTTFTLITPTTSTSPDKCRATTPQQQGRFKDAEAGAAPLDIRPPVEKEPVEDPQINEEGFGDDRIQLQDFLNMTSIRFMELTTTKRRHTIVPKATARGSDGEERAVSLEDCVAAGAATIPMLELFQHACGELKRYISEGRKTVREIETETFEENPPLFREYISATPDMKTVMDNQLKNVKTHARLLSKGMWYEWRMMLLGTLKEALFKTAEGMIQDEEALDQQQALLEPVLPPLAEKAERLEREEIDLQLAAEEIAQCDQEELAEARQRLIAMDGEVQARKLMIAEMCRSLECKEAEIENGLERKHAWQEEIRSSEKIREECRGWSSHEISTLKDKVDAIEREHGWTITGVSGTNTSMTYLKDVELVFDASSFLSKHTRAAAPTSNSRIDLWYIGANRELNPSPLTPEKEFFLQCIRDHIRGLPQATTPIQALLNAVSVSWNKALRVVGDIRSLTISCPTTTAKTSDDSMAVTSTLLIGPLTTKVEICFELSSQSGEKGIEVAIAPRARVVYGEKFNEPKMGEFLLNRCGGVVVETGSAAAMASWGDAVAELGAKLLARGRK